MFRVIGTGSYLPEKVLSNFDLEKMVDTTDQWITERTGIKERRIAGDNELNSDMATKAAKEALADAGLTPEDVDLIIVGTCTADYTLPAMAPIIQHNLGCTHIPAFDVNSVCTSFAYAFLTAAGMINSGFYKNCLIIGSDLYSRILNWQDRTTCCIFGDGAGAVVIQHDKKAPGILSHAYGANGEDAELIRIPVGGTKNPAHAKKDYSEDDYYFQMSGLDVYEFTINKVPEIIEELIENSNICRDTLDCIILHQANRRIIESVSKRTKIPIDKFIVNIDKVGNTSSASIPIAINHAIGKKKISTGDKVMLIGFGGGLSWGGVIFEW